MHSAIVDADFSLIAGRFQGDRGRSWKHACERFHRISVAIRARLTVEGRKLLTERIAAIGLREAAEAAGVSLGTAHGLHR